MTKARTTEASSPAAAMAKPTKMGNWVLHPPSWGHLYWTQRVAVTTTEATLGAANCQSIWVYDIHCPQGYKLSVADRFPNFSLTLTSKHNYWKMARVNSIKYYINSWAFARSLSLDTPRSTGVSKIGIERNCNIKNIGKIKVGCQLIRD